MKTIRSHFRTFAGAASVAVFLGLAIVAAGDAAAKGGKGGGGGGGGGKGGTKNYTVIHDIAKVNEALQGDSPVGYRVQGDGRSDSYEGHPPPWLTLRTRAQRNAYCREKHPSFNVATGLYTTYSGRQRRCSVP